MNALAIAYVGKAPEAAGFALAGLETFVPAPGGESEAFDRARSVAGLVLLDARCAPRLDRQRLEQALAAAAPITAIVDLAGGSQPGLDPVERARRQLGFHT